MVEQVLVTGCNGFIGSHLTERLLADGYSVVGLDVIPREHALNITSILHNAAFTYVQGDVTDAALINSLITPKLAKVFHLAAYVGIEKYIDTPIEVVRTNVVGTLNVLDACMAQGVYLFFSSTSEVYGRNPKIPWAEEDDRVLGPVSFERWSYSSSKGAAEQAVMGAFKQDLVKGCTVRFFNVYGPRQNPIFLVSRNIERAVAGQNLLMHNSGQQTRCFTYVDDAIDACMKLANSPHISGEVFNVGSDKEDTIEDVLKLIIEVSGKNIELEIINTDSFFGDSFEDIIRRVPNVNKIKHAIGWSSTTSLPEGLEKCYRWAQQQAAVPAR